MLASVVRKSSNLTIVVVVFRGFQCPCVVCRGLPWPPVVSRGLSASMCLSWALGALRASSMSKQHHHIPPHPLHLVARGMFLLLVSAMWSIAILCSSLLGVAVRTNFSWALRPLRAAFSVQR